MVWSCKVRLVQVKIKSKSGKGQVKVKSSQIRSVYARSYQGQVRLDQIKV